MGSTYELEMGLDKEQGSYATERLSYAACVCDTDEARHSTDYTRPPRCARVATLTEFDITRIQCTVDARQHDLAVIAAPLGDIASSTTEFIAYVCRGASVGDRWRRIRDGRIGR